MTEPRVEGQRFEGGRGLDRILASSDSCAIHPTPVVSVRSLYTVTPLPSAIGPPAGSTSLTVRVPSRHEQTPSCSWLGAWGSIAGGKALKTVSWTAVFVCGLQEI